MAPAFRPAIIATSALLVAQGERAWDESSMIQGMWVKDKHTNHRDPKSVSNLLETAGNMLRHGATPDVVNFTSTILDEITSVVLPAIDDSSVVDQDLLNDMYAPLAAALAELEQGLADVHHLQLEQESLSSSHRQCRDLEAVKCHDKVECDYDLYSKWITFKEEETEFRIISGRIDNHFCEEDANGFYLANGTLASFRATSVPYMSSFVTQKERVAQAEDDVDGLHPVCETKFSMLDIKTAECDAWQEHLERTACSRAASIRTLQNDFASAWNSALLTYGDTVAEVKLMEIDRIHEFKSIEVVKCLMGRIHERNGRPCDESTDEAETEYTHCEEVRTTVDITWLELIYPVVPPNPVLPPIGHWPCQDQYISHEYGSLPIVPTPDFHDTNSHCNSRPNCMPCAVMDAEISTELCTAIQTLGEGVHWQTTQEPYDLCADPTVTAAPITLPPTEPPAAGTCGPLPILINAIWNPSSDGDILQYHCEDGYSFDGYSFEITGEYLGRDTECLANGRYTQVRACLPVDDCAGHGCGAFGTCVDLHLDYTCQCVEGHEMNIYDGERICGTPQDCGGAQCGSGGVCEDLVSDYNCICHDGWVQEVDEAGFKTCERTECGDVPQVDNLMVQAGESGAGFPWTRGKAVFQDVVEYDCSDGYTTDGQVGGDRSFSISCLADTTFMPAVTPQCLPVTCVFQPDETHAADASYTMNYGSHTVICAEGHTFDGSAGGDTDMAATCDEHGAAAAPSCRPVTCVAGGLQFVENAQLTDSRDYTLGSQATYACNEGFAVGPSSSFEVECLRTGFFSATSTCSNIDDCVSHSCGEQGHCVDGIDTYSCNCNSGFDPVVTNGETICGDITNNCGTSACGGHGTCNDLANGYECVCEEGYVVQNPAADDRMCVARTCQITAMDGVSAASANGLRFPESSVLECAEGFSVGDGGARQFQIECNADGSLTSGGGALPACIPPVECQRPNAPATWEWVPSNPTNFNTQSSIQLRCASGYQSQHHTLNCLSGGIVAALPSACTGNTFTLSGHINSALGGRVSGASLTINGATVHADSNGYYSMVVPEGTHDYSLSNPNFITTTGSVTVTANTGAYNLIMSRVLAADQWRIVLSWGQTPSDLDSHLVFPACSNHMYYGATSVSCSGTTASLDVDDTSSYGPETTTLRGMNSQKVVYKVHNWSGPGNLETDTEVKLYNGQTLTNTFILGADGHSTGSGRSQYWKVFKIEGGLAVSCTSSNCN